MRKFLDDEGEQILDIAEHNIDKEIIAGNIEASMWALLNRKRGKARGYGPKQEIDYTDAEPAVFNIIKMSDREIEEEKLKHKQKLNK